LRQSIEARLQKLEAVRQKEAVVIAIVESGESKQQALARMGIDLAAEDQRIIYIIMP